MNANSLLRRTASLWILAGFLLTACGVTKATPAPTPTSVPPTATPAPTRTPAPTPTPSLAVNSLDDVKRATVQIEAQGTFVDPEFGLQTQAGFGSGFIVDESGLAVTNNHVVTGAA